MTPCTFKNDSSLKGIFSLCCVPQSGVHVAVVSNAYSIQNRPASCTYVQTT